MSLWANILEAIMENMIVFFTLISYGNIKVLLTDQKAGGYLSNLKGGEVELGWTRLGLVGWRLRVWGQGLTTRTGVNKVKPMAWFQSDFLKNFLGVGPVRLKTYFRIF